MPVEHRPSRPLATGLLVLLAAATLAACSGDTTATNHAMIAIDPLSLDFGKQPSGANRLKTLKISNIGTRELTIDGAEIRDDARLAFSVDGVPKTIAAGTDVTVSVTYVAPLEEGPDGARLVLSTNADNAPETQVSLAGRSELPCPRGEALCEGECVAVATSDAHCGTCGHACEAPDHCIAAECTCLPKTCDALAAHCGDVSDGCGQTLHCGTCSGADECLELRCVSPTCHDTRKNGSESDVDCGGTCPGCVVTQACRAGEDCRDGLVCTDHVCSPCADRGQCARGLICAGGLCGACHQTSDCDADEACVAGKCLACPSEAAFNECGLCAGAPVPAAGLNCIATSGCVSAYVCNAQKNGVACAPVAVNECGLCGGPAVPGLSTACTLPNGCTSALVCNDLKSGSTCAPVTKNTCGVCGGGPTPGIGASCTLPNGCASTMQCDGTGLSCLPVAKNECGLCGGAPVSGIGTSCTSSSGCSSTLECATDQLSTRCRAVTKNECGLCGGAAVPAANASCTLANGCASTQTCNADQLSTTCTPVTLNECGKCNGPALPAWHQACTNGTCNGQQECTATKDALTCVAANQNACGRCSGLVIPSGTESGKPCTSNTCPSTYTCSADLNSTSCTTVTKNACGVCGGPAVTGTALGTACQNATSTCSGTFVCNATNDATMCNAPVTCPSTGHLVISEISGYGIKGATDEFVEIYNPSSTTIDATNYTLWYHSTNSSGPWLKLLAFTGSKASIPAHHYVLAAYAAGSGFTESAAVPPDFTYNASTYNIDLLSATVALLKPSGTSAATSYSTALVADRVGYGSSALFAEGSTSTVEPPVAFDNSSVVRKAYSTSTATTMEVFSTPAGADSSAGNGIDTDNNGNDFVARNKRDPQNSASPAQP